MFWCWGVFVSEGGGQEYLMCVWLMSVFISSSAADTKVHLNVVPNSWLAHAYSWETQTGAAVAVTLGVGETGVSEVQGGRACRSVSRFQTSEFFWLKSLIRFIMHIPALIKVIGVWHSQCQSREPGNTSLPSPLSPCLFMHPPPPPS